MKQIGGNALKKVKKMKDRVTDIERTDSDEFLDIDNENRAFQNEVVNGNGSKSTENLKEESSFIKESSFKQLNIPSWAFGKLLKDTERDDDKVC